MPFVLSAGASAPPEQIDTLTLRAQTRPGGRDVLTLRAETRAAAYLDTLTLRAVTADLRPAQVDTLTLRAQTGGSAPSVVVIREGRSGVRTTTTLRLAGQVLPGLNYTHTRHPAHVQAQFTVAGIVRPADGEPMTVTVEQVWPDGRESSVTYEPVPATGDYQVEQDPTGAFRTVFDGRTRFDTDLVNTRLPELVPWLKWPSRQLEAPGYRSITRQTVGVSDVLTAAFQEADANIDGLSLLTGEFWEETRREFSTQGRSPQEVFADTYGRLGATLHLKNAGLPAWVPLFPGQSLGGAPLRLQYLTGKGEQAEVTQQPARVDLRIGDQFRPVQEYLEAVIDTGQLPDVQDETGQPQTIEIRDPELAQFEVKRDGILTGYVDRDGRRFAHYQEKVGGRLVRSMSVVTATVQVTYTVTPEQYQASRALRARKDITFNGEVYEVGQRTVENLVLSITDNRFEYLPGTTDAQALASSVSEHTTYTLTTDTQLQPASLPAALAAQVGAAVIGDLLGRESTRIRQVWSPQGGMMRERFTLESKVGEVGQEGLDDLSNPPPPPKAITVDEYTTAEHWTPTGGGHFVYERLRHGPIYTQVRDIDGGGEIVKTERRVGVIEHDLGITENAPPTLSDEVPDVEPQAAGTAAATADPLPFPVVTYLQDPVVASTLTPGRAPPVEIQLGVVRDYGRAQQLVKVAARGFAPRTVTRVQTPEAALVLPGQRLDTLGVVRQVTASGTASSHTLDVEVVRIHD